MGAAHMHPGIPTAPPPATAPAARYAWGMLGHGGSTHASRHTNGTSACHGTCCTVRMGDVRAWGQHTCIQAYQRHLRLPRHLLHGTHGGPATAPAARYAWGMLGHGGSTHASRHTNGTSACHGTCCTVCMGDVRAWGQHTCIQAYQRHLRLPWHLLHGTHGGC